jgi:hypothetical protein
MNNCKATLECEQEIRFIVDCDECKNIFVCANHIGTVINHHAGVCEETLHVDAVGGVHDAFCRRDPDNPTTKWSSYTPVESYPVSDWEVH